MSIFAIFAGFLYNEFYALPMYIFPSAWEEKDNAAVLRSDSYVYPFGVDPAWLSAENSLLYYNSLKMKLSVILGVTQMSLGVVLSMMNAWFFGNKYDLWFEAVPQMVFLQSYFGYMCFLVILKWLMDWKSLRIAAPRILNIMINMLLSPTSLESPLYSGQTIIQIVLLIVAITSVPLMLLPKPFLLRRDFNIRKGFRSLADGDDDTEDPGELYTAQEEVSCGDPGGLRLILSRNLTFRKSWFIK